MGDRNRKSKQQNKSVDPYELKNNLNNIRQKSNQPGCYQTDGIPRDGFVNKYSKAENITGETQTQTMSYDSFCHLDSKITNLNDKNENSHTTLRQELETKIDKKLDKQWYVWTIVGLVAIITLIWVLSYSNLISDVKKHGELIDTLRNGYNNIELKRR